MFCIFILCSLCPLKSRQQKLSELRLYDESGYVFPAL
jgi:hypothetical protein